MDSKAIKWGLTLGASAVTGMVTLYAKVKNAAITQLDRKGAFNELRKERADAIHQLHLSGTGETPAAGDAIPVRLSPTEEKARINKINQRYRNKKRDIIQRRNADSLTGAWQQISAEDKSKSLGFAAISSIVAGAVTYAVTSYAQNAKNNPGRGGSDGSSCGHAAGCGGHSHGCGGHGCGSGCGH